MDRNLETLVFLHVDITCKYNFIYKSKYKYKGTVCVYMQVSGAMNPSMYNCQWTNIHNNEDHHGSILGAMDRRVPHSLCITIQQNWILQVLLLNIVGVILS